MMSVRAITTQKPQVIGVRYLGVTLHIDLQKFRELLQSFTFGSEIETYYSMEREIDWESAEEAYDEWLDDSCSYDTNDPECYDWVDFEYWWENIAYEEDYYRPEIGSGILSDLVEVLNVEPYEDPSCGAEFPMEPVKDIKEFSRKLVNAFTLVYYNDDPIAVFNPDIPVGGHFNFSNANADIQNDTDLMDILLHISPILLYSSGDPRHGGRSLYNRFRRDYNEKFSAIHNKSYAIEARYFDGLTLPVSYILMSATNLILTAIIESIPEHEKERLAGIIREKYDDPDYKLYREHAEIYPNFGQYREYYLTQYKALLHLVSKVNNIVKEEWGLNLKAGLIYNNYRGSPTTRLSELDNNTYIRKEAILALKMGLKTEANDLLNLL